MDLDLRKLRYFTAVAEHGHFGRAAEKLHIAQPVLSRQIRALERELGCELLERTTRSVRLTPAGEQLYEDAPGVLATAVAATRRASGAARGADRLTVGFAPGLSISAAVREFAKTRPGVEVELVRLDWFEEAEALRDGRADLGCLRRPFDDTGIRTIAVGTEPKVACLPATHPLASRRRLTQADIDGEPVLHAQRRRITTIEEKLELVAAGRGIAMVPRSVARYYARPDLVHRPIAGADPFEICLAVADGHHRPHTAEFLRVAERVLKRR
ncbi:LysR family transcriptional regulator [Amycolatopsis endophytica]|uniref:DNA-binding transcriptional LysR family regulator n=1 Tax=Amycolatopsis endophytica TaxID=860233 RepID=A0A853B5W5_9PSEU|nr:LysR substrate-binding domain-containing protein [Amycolatopsis endophytica]NYI90633.1 DNA-binding transcriptional LysR family regulator [Amycolatopsis endophytica]